MWRHCRIRVLLKERIILQRAGVDSAAITRRQWDSFSWRQQEKGGRAKPLEAMEGKELAGMARPELEAR